MKKVRERTEGAQAGPAQEHFDYRSFPTSVWTDPSALPVRGHSVFPDFSKLHELFAKQSAFKSHATLLAPMIPIQVKNMTRSVLDQLKKTGFVFENPKNGALGFLPMIDSNAPKLVRLLRPSDLVETPPLEPADLSGIPNEYLAQMRDAIKTYYLMWSGEKPRYRILYPNAQASNRGKTP